MGEVEDLAVQLGEVPGPDPARVAGRVADRVGDEHGEEVQPPREPQLQRAPDDGADEGRDPGVGPPDLNPAVGAHELDGQHPGRVGDLLGEVDLEVAEHLPIRAVLQPAPDRRELRVLRERAAPVDDLGQAGFRQAALLTNRSVRIMTRRDRRVKAGRVL